jgi:hypothetical protein
VYDVLREVGLLRWEPQEEALAEGLCGEGLTPPTPWLLTAEPRPAAPDGVVPWRDLVLHLYDADRLRQLGHYRVKVAEDETRIRVAGWLINLTQRRVRGVGSLLYDWLRDLYPTVPVEHPGQTEAGKRWWAEYCRSRGYDPADPYA